MSPSIGYRRVRLCSRLALFGALLGAVVATAPPLTHAQGNGPGPDEMRWGLHVTLASRWLDPAETEAFSTPFMVMYAIHEREALVHDIQKIIRDKVTDIPLFEQAFIWGVGPRVEEAGAGRIAGFSYSAPFEDLRLKK